MSAPAVRCPECGGRVRVAAASGWQPCPHCRAAFRPDDAEPLPDPPAETPAVVFEEVRDPAPPAPKRRARSKPRAERAGRPKPPRRPKSAEPAPRRSKPGPAATRAAPPRALPPRTAVEPATTLADAPPGRAAVSPPAPETAAVAGTGLGHRRVLDRHCDHARTDRRRPKRGVRRCHQRGGAGRHRRRPLADLGLPAAENLGRPELGPRHAGRADDVRSPRPAGLAGRDGPGGAGERRAALDRGAAGDLGGDGTVRHLRGVRRRAGRCPLHAVGRGHFWRGSGGRTERSRTAARAGRGSRVVRRKTTSGTGVATPYRSWRPGTSRATSSACFFSLRRARPSSWRIRSFVTPNLLPTCSSVCGSEPCSRP